MDCVCVWDAPCLLLKWLRAGFKLMCIVWLCAVFFCPQGRALSPPLVFWGICWHIQRTIPSRRPPSHRGCSIHLRHCYFLCLGLCRFIELLIFSCQYWPQGEKFMLHISGGLVHILQYVVTSDLLDKSGSCHRISSVFGTSSNFFFSERERF